MKTQKCKTFECICRMLSEYVKNGGKIFISSRPMPSRRVLDAERKELMSFLRQREARRKWRKERLLFLKEKDEIRKAKRIKPGESK